MDSRAERNAGVVDLSEKEFREQVNTAREVLNTVYQTSQPLLMLGYNGAQIRVLQGIYAEVEGGIAVNARRNDNSHPFYRHYTRFENGYGSVGLSFSGNGDYQASGLS